MSVLSLKNGCRTEWPLIGNQKQWSWKAAREETEEPSATVVAQFRPWWKRPRSLCHHLTYSPVWNGSSCFFTVPHNGTKWLWLAKLQLAAKRPRCREREGVKRALQKREQCCHVINDTERACTLTIWADINITSFFLLQQRIREALTEATDGLGSHRLQKYLEVYTSQTRSQIGSKTKAVLWGGKKKYCSLVFNLSSSRGVNKYCVSDSLMSADIETPNFIRRLSDSALSGLKAAQAWQYANEVCLY